MPRIRYICSEPTCKKEFYATYPAKVTFENIRECIQCGKKTGKRQLGSPSSKSVIVVDNGVQARAVEIDLKVIESNKETSQKGYNRGD